MCKIAGCLNERNYRDDLCFYHYKWGGETKDKKPKTAPIAKQSDKQKERMKKYMPIRNEFLARPENKKCAAKLDGCQKEAKDVHHKAGKVGNLLFDEAHFLPVCRHCHSWLEVNPKRAVELGFSESRLIIISEEQSDNTSFLLAQKG